MIIERLKVDNAIGFENVGSSVDLDFTQFAPGAIALVGDNGAGKTFLMENCHPWPYMPSRKGFAEHFVGKNAGKDITIKMPNGDLYRFLLKVNADSARVERYVYLNGEAVNDGKRESYDEIVTRLFGSKESFFKTVFAVQNDDGIGGMTDGGRKKLISDMCDLDQLQLISDAALAQKKDAKAKLAIKDNQTATMHDEVDGIPQVEDTIKRINENLEEFKTTLCNMDLEKDQLNIEIQELKLSESKQADVKKQASDLYSKLDDKRTDLESLKEKKNRTHDSFAAINAELEKQIGYLQGLLNDADQHRLNLQLKKEQVALDDQLAKLKEQYRTLSMAAQNKAGDIQRARMDHNSLISVVKENITAAEKLAEPLNDVPCQDEEAWGFGEGLNVIENCKACPLIAQATEAADKIVELDNQLTELKATDPVTEEMKAELKTAEEAREANIEAGKAIREQLKDEKYEQCPLTIDTLEKAVLQLNEASTKLEMYQKQLADAKPEQEKATQDMTDQVGKAFQEVTRLEAELKNLESEIDNQVSAKLAQAQEARDNAAHQVEVISNTILGQEKGLAAREADLERLTGLKTKLDELNIEIEKVKVSIRRWQKIETAFSRVGIQIFKIEAAAPSITEEADKILATFKKDYRLKIRTTRLGTEGQQIECFEIKVLTDKGEKKVENLSGGQAIWVDTALRIALSIFRSKVNSQHRFMTRFYDEKDGALTTDMAWAYYQAIMAGHDASGCHHTLFVSHRDEFKDQCTQAIEFDTTAQAVKVVA
jgi:DNA repair exonuclease SbcCD ATPase subunit